MKTLIIMRGLPWSGKSYRAEELAGEDGVIFSTDEYWYKIYKPEEPDKYTWNPRFIADAHKWNQLRTQRQIDLGNPLIIVDNTNTVRKELFPYADYAYWQDYKICIEEPTSERWLEIRQLLTDKRGNKKALKEWAAKLAEGSLETHQVPAYAIEKMMWRWECDLALEDILDSETHKE
jgi:hypothetical protein